jgi:hypothetical protein
MVPFTYGLLFGFGGRLFRSFDNGFFFFGHLVAPAVVADAQIAWHGFGFANADLAAFFEELFDQIFVGCGFDDLFHCAEPSLRPGKR